MNSKYADKAIPLISVNPSGKYVLTKEAEDFLRSVPGPIGVVSVAGLYRTGKSYLLNQMILNRSNGFGVGPTVNPCTKGLWCWGSPIKGVTPDGEKLNIIVIDTEGIGALDEDQTHDTRIFTLAILASSCFIYNSVGSIDQTAVQNLSLVVNLTKHIQLSTSKSTDEEDPDKIANYFPSFFWVVRDFSLRVEDADGNKMTSKEYLEKALAPQKGFSDDVEEKNRIRRLLTSFFKDRDCITLIRPLIDETKLQDLDKMKFDELRPQFGNQVLEFRKRVLTRMKPKTMNGQKLSGDLYLSMLNSYVGAINEGAVPNIENAWNYMCQEQCTKVINESYEVYEKQIRQMRIPCTVQQMNSILDKAEQESFEFFKKNSIGEETNHYFSELRIKLKKRSENIRTENADAGKLALKKYYEPFTKPIQKKLTSEQYGSLEEFIDDLKKFEAKVEKEGPNYVDAKLVLYMAMKALLTQGANFIFKKMKNEKQNLMKTHEEKNKLNENQIENLKKERQNEQVNTRKTLNQLDEEKTKMAFEIEKMKMELANTSKDKAQKDQELTKMISEQKKEIEQLKTKSQKIKNQTTTQVQLLETTLREKEINWQKERSVFEQKVKLQSEKLDSFEKSKNTLNSKLASDTAEFQRKHEQTVMKYEETIQGLNKQLSAYTEKSQQLERNLENLKNSFQELNEKYEYNERKHKQDFFAKNQQIDRLKKEQQIELNRLKNDLEQNNDDNERGTREMQQKIKKQEGKLKELTEENQKNKNQLEKITLISRQQQEHLKQRNQKLQEQLKEKVTHLENKIALLESEKGMLQDEMFNRKIDELNEQHETLMNEMREQYDDKLQRTQSQLDKTNNDKNALEVKYKVTLEELSQLKIEKNENEMRLRTQKEDLERKIKSIERERQNQIMEQAGSFEEQIKRLRRELEEEKENHDIERSEEDRKMNEQLTQIKNYYELQREESVKNHLEQKESMKTKFDKWKRQAMEKWEQEKEELEEELEAIKMESENQILSLRTINNDIIQERDSLSKEKGKLENQFNSLSAKYQKLERESLEKIEKMTEIHKNEKESLENRIRQLMLEKNNIEKEKLSLSHELGQLTAHSQKLQIQYNETSRDFIEYKTRFEAYKNDMERKLRDQNQKAMNFKSKSETTIAVQEQKITFLEEKKNELEKQYSETKEKMENQKKQFQEKYDRDVTQKKKQLESEKKRFQEKNEMIKKKALENEGNLQRQISEMNREAAIMNEKLANTEKVLAEVESAKMSIEQNYDNKIKSLKDKFSVERSELKSNVEKLQQKIARIENESTKTISQLEMNIVLLENKLKNAEQSKEAEKKDRLDHIKSLEFQLQEMREQTRSQKSSQEQSHQLTLQKIENKYRNDNAKLTQDLARTRNELQNKKADYDRMLQDLTEKVALEKQAKQIAQGKITKLDTEWRERFKKLEEELDKVRQQVRIKSERMEETLAAQKKFMKEKLEIEERKKKEAEREKTQMRFAYEKDLVAMKSERENLFKRIEEYKETCENYVYQNKKLSDDNHKLKAERKKNTSFIRGNQTTFIAREVPVENKENTQYQ